MKYFISLLIVICFPRFAASQDSINPYNTGQHANIILQNTDVYYNPFAPPSPTDNRGQLSCIAFELRDPNGARSNKYDPITHDSELQYWKPHGSPIGQFAMWMRLFTAANQADGSPSNIIVGDSVTTGTAYGSVTVDSLEDVDFNASGTIEMESGFHVLPGASFHAYIEPTWSGTCATAGDSGNGLVFCDEFADSALSKWTIGVGYGGNIINEANCGEDTNVTDRYADPDAEDGYALKLDLHYDSCNCKTQNFAVLAGGTNLESQRHSGCDEIDETTDTSRSGTMNTFHFNIGDVTPCPWPFKTDTYPLQPAYQNMPYGKCEVRAKVPHVYHHENTYGNTAGNNGWNLDEVNIDDGWGMSKIAPYLAHPFVYGPYRGIFDVVGASDTVFLSPDAHFSQHNGPTVLSVNNVMFPCYFAGGPADTVKLDENVIQVPSLSFGDTINFYYERSGNNTSDVVTWSVDSTGRYFTGPYGVPSPGDSLFFTKGYQPTSIRLPVGLADTTLSCLWDSVSGKIYLSTPFPSGALHSRTSNFTYTVDEGPDYPYPHVPMDTNGYVYHTYAVELFPHECEFLVDSIVVLRFPDRMVPTNDLRYDYVSKLPRFLTGFILSSLGIDPGNVHGEDSTETAYFLAHVNDPCPGCWDGAAHGLIDYVKIWDLPNEFSAPPIEPTSPVLPLKNNDP